MKKMKAVLASLLAAMLCLAVTGCGGGSDSGEASPSSEGVS